MLRFILPALIGISLCLSQALGASGRLDELKKRGTLRVGMEPGFLPFEMQTPQGEWVGFDVEMIKAFAAKLGVKPEFIATKWDGIIPGLMAGKYDVITSGMTITPERAKAVLFSDPYYVAGLRVLLSKQAAETVKNLESLDQSQHTILVKLGTTGDIFATKTFKKAQIRRLDNEADAAQAVALGRGSAFVYDRPYLEIFESTQKAKEKDKIRVVLMEGQVSSEDFGLAAKKSDQELVAAFNAFLKEWKAQGAYDKVYKAMFVDLSWKSQFPL